MKRLRIGWRAEVVDGHLEVGSDTRRYRLGAADWAQGCTQALADGFRGPERLVARGRGQRLVDQLDAKNLLTDADGPDDPRHRSRLAAYFEHVGLQDHVAARVLGMANVLILGLGGTGTVVLQHLLGAGVRRFVLVDRDVVEEGNLERQFIYGMDAIGLPKTRAASAYVRQRARLPEVREIQLKLRDRHGLEAILAEGEPVDAAAVCIDHPPGAAFDFTSQALWAREIPFVHGGVMIRSGFFGPFFAPSMSRHPPKLFPIFRPAPRTSRAPEPVPICFAPYNTIIGAYMAADLIHWLVGQRAFVDCNRRTFVDFDRLSFTKLAADVGPESEV